MKLTKKQAKDLSIKKWEYIIKNNGDGFGLLIEIPELNKLKYNCGFCEKYIYSTGGQLIYCRKCPIRPKLKDYNNDYNSGCLQDVHFYKRWGCAINPKDRIKYAKLLLDQIKES